MNLLSLIYRAGTATRNLAFDAGLLKQESLPGKVISVGNLAVGGTGKSPVVIELARFLQRRGFKPAILTRGYGSGLKPADSLALVGKDLVMGAGWESAVPDEAQMQARALMTVPVVCGARRAQAARRFLVERPEHAPTHWILDDGFQHRQIKRDLDVVLLDAKRPFAGFLREGPSALRRADLVLFTRASDKLPLAADLAKAEGHSEAVVALLPFTTSRPEGFDPTRHSPAFLASAIAEPTRLIQDVQRQLQIPLSGTLVAADHRPLPRSELLANLGEAKAVLTTAKDYWRDPAVFADLPVPAFVLPLAVEWDEEQLAKALSSVL